MSNDNSGVVTKKLNIQPITFSIELTAERVNENGTFSGIKVTSVKSSSKELAGHLRVSAPPMGGGRMFLITDSLKGVKVLGEVKPSSAKPEKKKLF